MNKKILASFTMLALVMAYSLPFSLDFGSLPEAQASQSDYYPAQSDYYLEIDGIDGEVTTRGHEKSIEVMSWSWGASNPTTVGGGGMGSGKVQFQDFHFTKTVDKATPKLFLACVSGKHISTITLSLVKPSSDGGAPTFMKYTFSDVMCNSFTNSADPLTEELSFNYGKISMEYTPMTSDGTAGTAIKAGWDIKANKAN